MEGQRRRTAAKHHQTAGKADFYRIIGSTPFANDYQFDFARSLITNEKLGQGPATDLLIISLSANDILGHQVGPDSPHIEAMALALDHQLSQFFGFLGKQIGLGNVWLALSADHGISPLPSVASGFRIPAANLDERQLSNKLNEILSALASALENTYLMAGSRGPFCSLTKAHSQLRRSTRPKPRRLPEKP